MKLRTLVIVAVACAVLYACAPAEEVSQECYVPHLLGFTSTVPIYCSAVQAQFDLCMDILVKHGRTTKEGFYAALEDLRVEYVPDYPNATSDHAGDYTRIDGHGRIRLFGPGAPLIHELLHHFDFLDGIAAQKGNTASGHLGWDTNGYEDMINEFTWHITRTFVQP